MGFKIPAEFIEKLRHAQKVTISTGAGTSAESGVPTFREAQTGLWALYDPEQLATPQAFRKNPRLVWDWYAWRRSLVTNAEPNAGHLALAQMAGLIPELVLITQNIDGLHQRAGNTDVIELHGNIMRSKCSHCMRIALEFEETEDPPPTCPNCRGLLRPDVVWFGESLPYESLVAARKAARDCDIFFSIGTSSLVQPAASLPLEALDRGNVVVEINPAQTPLSSLMTYVLSGSSGFVLPELVKATWPDC